MGEGAVLRLEFDGDWTVAEFTSLLRQLTNAYASASAFAFLATPDASDILPDYVADLPEIPELDIAPSLHYDPSQRHRSRAQSAALRRVVRIASRHVQPLTLDAIRYGSPGFLELLGSVNPLKVIHDVLVVALETVRARWKEQTARERLRIRAELEMQKIVWIKQRELLDRMSPQWRDAFAAELLWDTIRPSSSIAHDPRVKAIAVEEGDDLEDEEDRGLQVTLDDELFIQPPIEPEPPQITR